MPIRKNMFFLKTLKFNLTWTLDRKAKGEGGRCHLWLQYQNPVFDVLLKGAGLCWWHEE